LVTADDLKKIEAEVKKEVDAATALARTDGEIDVKELTCDIYQKNLDGDVRGITPEQWWKHITLNRAVNL
jgi:pyruvate dehydrogenase E1 component alpha subunit